MFADTLLKSEYPLVQIVRALDNADMTASIDDIQQKIAADQFEFSKHAVDQSILRKIRVQEVREAIANGKILEDYPSRSLIKVITLYQPNPAIWTKRFTERRKNNV